MILREWQHNLLNPAEIADRYVDWVQRYKRVKRNVLTSREFEEFMVSYLLEVMKI